MANLTLTIDDELLRQARIRALERGTSVNAVVREYLEHFAGHSRAQDGAAAFLRIAEGSSGSSGPTGRSWTRDDAYGR
jgi:plasmid stability protein